MKEAEQPVAGMDPHTATVLRHWFGRLNRWLMLPMWRLGLGWMLNAWPSVGGRLMVLITTGHRSGLPRLAPLNYSRADGYVYCLAGFGRVAHWYRNLTAQPAVEVWLPDGHWSGVAEDVTEADDAIDRFRDVFIASGFAAWVAGFRPKRMTDEDYAATTRDYRLVRIQLTGPAQSETRPGDLAWVWKPVGWGLAALWMARWWRRCGTDD